MSRMIETWHRAHAARRMHAIDLAVPARAQHAGRVRMTSPARLLQETDSSRTAVVAARSRKVVGPHQQSSAQFLGLDDQTLSTYQHLYEQVRKELDAGQHQCICVTSSRKGEGKTSTSVNLAFVAAQAADQRVLVVDANLRRPQVAERLGLSLKVGLSDVLCDGLFPSEAIRPVAPVGYSVLAAGRETKYGLSLLDSRRMGVLLRNLKESYDLIIVDALHVVDQSVANRLSRFFDVVFVVVQMHRTRRQVVERAVRMLQRGGANVRGCILTHNGKVDGIIGGPTGLAAAIEQESDPATHPDRSAPVPEQSLKAATPCALTSQEQSQTDGFLENMVVALERWVQSTASQPAATPCETSSPVSGPMLEQSEEPETGTDPPSLVVPRVSVDGLKPEAQAKEIGSPPSLALQASPDCTRKIKIDGPLGDYPPEAPEDAWEIGDLANETNSGQNNSWAANVLAICGGLLILASLLYVAVDVAIWF